MTKETSTAALQARIAQAPRETTVFSDGSTFDYENGYQSNGAPIATRDRTENPKIVKTGVIMTPIRWAIALMLVGLLAVVAGIAAMVLTVTQAHENYEALEKGLTDSGEVEVLDGNILDKLDSGTVLLNIQGNIIKCDVSIAKKTDAEFTDVVDNKTMEADVAQVETVMAYVFCEPGKSATASIPVPHDPDNIFYVAPEKEAKH